MKKIILPLFILSIAVIVNSCRRDKYIPNVCFKENILPVFISKCGTPGCHNSSSGKDEKLNLTTYDGIMKGITPNHPAQSEIWNKIKGKNPEMPPQGSPQLTAKELDNIEYWINFGAKNTSCGVTNCDTLTYITYNNTIKDIMTSNCTGCHYTGNPQSYIPLDTYNGVFQNASTVLTRINLPATDPFHMPVGNSLSTCDISKIQKWVNNGKPQQ